MKTQKQKGGWKIGVELPAALVRKLERNAKLCGVTAEEIRKQIAVDTVGLVRDVWEPATDFAEQFGYQDGKTAERVARATFAIDARKWKNTSVTLAYRGGSVTLSRMGLRHERTT